MAIYSVEIVLPVLYGMSWVLVPLGVAGVILVARWVRSWFF